MIISHKQRFIIFAPWKNASSTTHLRLAEYNESPYSRFYYFSPQLQRVVHQHLTCAEFSSFPESKLGYFSASFVRNPYDRVYAGFLQLQKQLREQPNAVFPAQWIRELVMKQLAENLAQLSSAEFDFNRWLHSVQEHQILEIGRNTSFPLHPSHYWTHLAGSRMVDFVGKVESFEADFQRLCSTVGITCKEKFNANVSDKECATENEDGYRYLSRMNDVSIRKINDLFRTDFELFGYKYVDPQDPDSVVTNVSAA